LFHIIKIIIVSIDALSMIYNTFSLIFF